jgi:KDO2-lipid IV(A) lauroyltransferase
MQSSSPAGSTPRRLGARRDGESNEAVAEARFSTRTYSLRDRLYMDSIDAVLAGIGWLLWLGGLPLKRTLCFLLGNVGYVLLAKQRRIARINLDLAYGATLSAGEKRRINRGTFVHFVRLGLDFIFDRVYWPPAKLARRVRPEGLENLQAAFDLGRGVLCVSGHIGNWEMMCASAAAHGCDFFGVFKPPKSAWADRFIGRKRLRYGMSLLETPASETKIIDGRPTRVAPRSLREDVERIWASGRAVAFLCDQYPGKRSMRVPFLGVDDTPTAGGLLRYAVENRVPLTFHHCVYGEDGNLVWTIEGPTEIADQPGGEEATLRHYLCLVNDWLSERIKQHPEQWTWGHRRFDRAHYARQG